MKSLIDQMQKDADDANSGDSPFLTLKDKEQFRIRFLQELSEDAPGYGKERGLASYVKIHQNPKNFKRSAVCTKDSGDCYGCDQYAKGTKEAGRWKPKGRLYINTLVTTPDGDKVKVLQQSLFAKHVALALMEFAAEYGSVTDRDYKIKRSGSDMNNTSYSLTPLEKSPLPDDVDSLELVDLTKVVRHIPAADQEAFYEETESETEGSGW